MTLASRSAGRVLNDFYIPLATPRPTNIPRNHPHIGVKIVVFAIFVASVLGLISYSWSHRFLVEAARVQASSVALDSIASRQISVLESQQTWQVQVFPWQAQDYSVAVHKISTENTARAHATLQDAITNTQQTIAALRMHAQSVVDFESPTQSTLPQTLQSLESALLLATKPQDVEKIKKTVEELTISLDTEVESTRKAQFTATIAAQFATKKPDIDLLLANESADFQSFLEYFNQVKNGAISPIATSAKNLADLQKENADLVQPLLIRTSLLANDERARLEKVAVEQQRIDAEQQKAREQALLTQKLAAEKQTATPPPPLPMAKSIAVDLSDQMMYAYENGVVIKTSPITSGKDSTPTVTGTFHIYQKLADTYLQGADYRLHVDYWMPFYDGYGIHDAYWRHIFGGEDYHNRGSHGCLNTPDDMVVWIWNWAPVGTTVTVQE